MSAKGTGNGITVGGRHVGGPGRGSSPKAQHRTRSDRITSQTYRQPLVNHQHCHQTSHPHGTEENEIKKKEVGKGREAYLSVINRSSGEESIERVVARDDETGQVDQKLAGDVEEDEEEVDADQTEDDVDLGDGGLTLEVVEDGVLGELVGEGRLAWLLAFQLGARR